MALGLPYFKFIVTEWLTGDIVYEELEIQGLFINICAIYWQRNGILTVDDIEKRYKKPEALKSLLQHFISANDGKISIKFLDEQLSERGEKSVTNSKNGSLGGRPKGYKTLNKKPNANRTLTEPKANESHKEEEIEEEKNKTISKEDKFILECLNSQRWMEAVCMKAKIKLNDFIPLFSEYKIHLAATSENHLNLKDFQQHFVYWTIKKPKQTLQSYNDNSGLI